MTLTRKTELKRTTPMKAGSFLRVRDREAKATDKLIRRMKTRGMKGRAPTAEEQRFMDAIGGIGCIACLKDGIVNAFISLHHIDGRTKPGAHFETLPLCAPHHQPDSTDPMQRISLHGHKKPFQRRYGTEMELLLECIALVRHKLVNPDGNPIRLPDEITALLEPQQEAA